MKTVYAPGVTLHRRQGPGSESSGQQREAGASAPSLDQQGNTVSVTVLDGSGRSLTGADLDKAAADGRLFKLRGCRCGSRFCNDCGPRMGRAAIEKIVEKSYLFPAAVLVTLTIDRRKHASCESAFDTVLQNRYLPRLMALLGKDVPWIRVLEFQSKTGDGWPHWHLLVDVSRFGLKRIPVKILKEMWRFWKDVWGLGSVDVQEVDFKTREHALRYVGKYLTKQPQRGWPSWVLARDRIRLIESSRVVGKIISEGSHSVPADAPADDAPSADAPADDRRVRSIDERISRCKLSCVVFQEGPPTAEKPVFRYACTLPTSIDLLIRTLKQPPRDLLVETSGGRSSSLRFDIGEREPLILVRRVRPMSGYTAEDVMLILPEWLKGYEMLGLDLIRDTVSEKCSYELELTAAMRSDAISCAWAAGAPDGGLRGRYGS